MGFIYNHNSHYLSVCGIMCPGRILHLAVSQHLQRCSSLYALTSNIKSGRNSRWNVQGLKQLSFAFFLFSDRSCLLLNSPHRYCLCVCLRACVWVYRVYVCVCVCVRVCVFLPCSSSLLGSWSARGCKTVLVDSFRTKCVCDRLSTFAILARLNPEMVSLSDSLDLVDVKAVGDGVGGLVGFNVFFLPLYLFVKGHHCRYLSRDPPSCALSLFPSRHANDMHL